MKTLPVLVTALLTAIVGLADPGPVQDADLPVVQPQADQRTGLEPHIEDLAFLSGTWAGGDGSTSWEAVYSSPDGGQVVAASKEIKDGRVIMIDFEHFYERDGKLRLTPYPFGNKSVEFTLSRLDPEQRMAIFENLEHDFPKRFTYQRTDDEHLRIELEGDMGGGPTTMVLEFERVGE
jgi:hypothetical protein